MKKINILFISSRVNFGGIANVLYQYISFLSNDNSFHITFISYDNQETDYGTYEEFYQKHNVNVIRIPESQKSINKFRKDICKILKTNKYDIIHCNLGAISSIVLYEAKKHNIPVRIIHSHTCNYQESFIQKFRRKIYKFFINKCSTAIFGCSNDAISWIKPKKYKHNSYLIYNAFDVNNFIFNESTRDFYRKKYNLGNEIVLGYTGRLTAQKNIKFCIDLIEQLSKEINAILFLVGDGELRTELEDYVKTRNLSDFVVFIGNVTNVNEYLNLFDVFIIPSFYEGLCLSFVEAQINGLPCIASKCMPNEARISQNNIYINVKDRNSLDIAANNILKNKLKRINFNTSENNKYDIEIEWKNLRDIYISLLEKSIK